MQNPTHREYPKMMQHPHFRKSQATKLNPELNDKKSDFQGSPERFPPVLVHSEDDEELYTSQGYVTVGTSDPAAFARSVQSAPPPDYKPLEYPKWLGGVLVTSADQEAELFPAQTAEVMLDGQGEADGGNEASSEDEAQDDAPKAQRGRPRKVH